MFTMVASRTTISWAMPTIERIHHRFDDGVDEPTVHGALAGTFGQGLDMENHSREVAQG